MKLVDLMHRRQNYASNSHPPIYQKNVTSGAVISKSMQKILINVALKCLSARQDNKNLDCVKKILHFILLNTFLLPSGEIYCGNMQNTGEN